MSPSTWDGGSRYRFAGIDEDALFDQIFPGNSPTVFQSAENVNLIGRLTGQQPEYFILFGRDSDGLPCTAVISNVFVEVVGFGAKNNHWGKDDRHLDHLDNRI
jgi:hypothetical protein